MAVTLKTIAHITGVSIGTVARALHKKGRINPEVAERIRAVAESLDYKTNTVAKSLALRNKKQKIGVIVRKNSYFDTILNGIEKARNEIKDFGITLSIKCTETFDYKEQLTAIDAMIEKNVTALVIAPVTHPEISKKINGLFNKGIHIIFLTRTCENASFTSFVGCNYKRMGELSAGLINLLHPNKGNVCLFAPNLAVKEHRDRVQSFQDTVEQRYPQLTINAICELSNNEIDNYKATLATLECHPDTDIVLYTNGIVKGGYQALKEYTQKKPLKIVGYDLFETVKEGLLDNSILATITQLPEEQGYKAIMLLFNFLAKDEEIKHTYYIEPQIVIKENLLDISHGNNP